MAFRSVAAGQGDQVGFTPIIQLAIPVGLGMVVEHAVQALLDVPPLGAKHRARRRVQRRRHLGCAPALVGLEQDARPIDDPSGVLAFPDQALQLGSVFLRQPYRKFLLSHGCRTYCTVISLPE